MIARLIAVALAAVALATPAGADPAKDTIKLLRKNDLCPAGSDRECLRFHGEEMAERLGYQEAALTVCPDLYVTDQKLRELRWKKCGKYDRAFQEGWNSVVERVSPRAKAEACIWAGNAAYSSPYEQKWLERDPNHGYTDETLAL